MRKGKGQKRKTVNTVTAFFMEEKGQPRSAHCNSRQLQNQLAVRSAFIQFRLVLAFNSTITSPSIPYPPPNNTPLTSLSLSLFIHFHLPPQKQREQSRKKQSNPTTQLAEKTGEERESAKFTPNHADLPSKTHLGTRNPVRPFRRWCDR